MRELVLNSRRSIAAAFAWMAICLPAQVPAADRLILRNLDIFSDRTVTALDEDGLVVAPPRPGSGDRITWDEIERGTIALDQARFDALLKELGPPLYRIRQRLKIGDYDSLATPAELLYPRYAERKGPTAYMVCQATMWSRFAAGKRESAVGPYLRCFELLRAGTTRAGVLPGNRRLALDAKTGLSPELQPVWFDPEAARLALPDVQQAIRDITQPRPAGVYVYYASLALAAGDSAEFDRVLPSIRSDDAESAPWRAILLAQREVLAGSPGSEVEALRTAADSMPNACRPAALYWLGLADVQSADEQVMRDGILALLTLPAVYRMQQPELAAAGLYHAASALDKLKDDRDAAAVRYELTSQFGATYYGAKARSAGAAK